MPRPSMLSCAIALQGSSGRTQPPPPPPPSTLQPPRPQYNPPPPPSGGLPQYGGPGTPFQQYNSGQGYSGASSQVCTHVQTGFHDTGFKFSEVNISQLQIQVHNAQGMRACLLRTWGHFTTIHAAKKRLTCTWEQH